MLTERQALSKALDMLAAISGGKTYSTGEFYDAAVQMEVALSPTLADHAALRNFASRTECNGNCATFGMCRHNVIRPE